MGYSCAGVAAGGWPELARGAQFAAAGAFAALVAGGVGGGAPPRPDVDGLAVGGPDAAL